MFNEVIGYFISKWALILYFRRLFGRVHVGKVCNAVCRIGGVHIKNQFRFILESYLRAPKFENYFNLYRQTGMAM